MHQLIPCAALMPEVSGSNDPLSKFCSQWRLLANDADYIGLGKLVETVSGLRWQMQDGRSLELGDVTRWAVLSLVSTAMRASNVEPLLDEEGYPTAYALHLLETWPWADQAGWLALAQELWEYPERFQKKVEDGKTTFLISTAGWSGNEAVIGAMKRNHLMWSFLWKESRRGGWYVLELSVD